jgi:hypothetical protein
MSFKVFGVEIERKTDILAFAAFIISIGSLLSQFINLIRGPEIILDGPNIVTLYSGYGSDEKEYLRLSTGLIYLNMGSPGYHDFIKSEEALLSTDTDKIKLTAKYYIKTKSDLKKMFLEVKGDAVPVAVKSGTTLYHETEFGPFPSKANNRNVDFVVIDSFIDKLKQSSKLTVKFIIKTYSGQSITKECLLDPNLVALNLTDKKKTINDKKIGWASVLCE